jgi:hypothetical protein
VDHVAPVDRAAWSGRVRVISTLWPAACLGDPLNKKGARSRPKTHIVWNRHDLQKVL